MDPPKYLTFSPFPSNPTTSPASATHSVGRVSLSSICYTQTLSIFSIRPNLFSSISLSLYFSSFPLTLSLLSPLFPNYYLMMMPPPTLRGCPEPSISFVVSRTSEDSGNTLQGTPLPPPSAHKNLFIGRAVGGEVIFVGIVIVGALLSWFRRKDPAPTSRLTSGMTSPRKYQHLQERRLWTRWVSFRLSRTCLIRSSSND